MKVLVLRGLPGEAGGLVHLAVAFFAFCLLSSSTGNAIYVVRRGLLYLFFYDRPARLVTLPFDSAQ